MKSHAMVLWAAGLISTVVSGIACADAGWYARDGAAPVLSDPTRLYRSPLAGEAGTQPAESVVRLFSGYRLDDIWALEAGYLSVDGFDRAALTGAKHEAGESLSGLALQGTARLPLDRHFSLSGRVGLTRWSGLTADTAGTGRDFLLDTDLSYGAGGEYRLTDRFSLSAEWDRYRFDERDLDLFSAGVRYRFE